jgi:predicted short-subunit dehydrogenase-like oxidoreductase (DUF2520 family)
VTTALTTGPPRLAVGIVGVGRVGSVLGAALGRAGHEVEVVHAVSETSRLRAQALLPAAEIVSVEAVFSRADLVLLTVPDDALAPLVRSVTEQGWIRPGQFLVHCSGRYGIEVLAPATLAGVLPLALHPVMSLTGTSLDLDRLTGCPFGVTAPAALETVAAALVVEMGGEPMIVAEASRPLYHAALAHSSNHIISLVAEAMDLLRSAGVADPAQMLRPLLSASLDNALAYGDQALTGPVARGDAETVTAHLREMNQVSAHSAAAYRAMARRTADRALAAGVLSPSGAERLLDVLAEGNGSA